MGSILTVINVEKPTHKLKTLPVYFNAVEKGIKKFEIRNNNDRDFQCGDIVILCEFDKNKLLGQYTGREISVQITYVTNYEQQQGFVVFGFVVIE